MRYVIAYDCTLLLPFTPHALSFFRCKKGRKIIMRAAKNAGGVQLRTQSTQTTQPHHHAEATGNTATTAPSVAARTM